MTREYAGKGVPPPTDDQAKFLADLTALETGLKSPDNFLTPAKNTDLANLRSDLA